MLPEPVFEPDLLGYSVIWQPVLAVALRLAGSLSQVRGRRPRSARTLRKVKYDDYELDFGASQSQGEGDLPLHTPKRQKVPL